MAEDGTLIQHLDESLRHTSCNLTHTGYDRWAEKLASNRSLDMRKISQRLKVAALRGLTPRLISNEKQASFGEYDPHLEDVARDYAAYQLVVLSQMPSDPAGKPLTAGAVILQNYSH